MQQMIDDLRRMLEEEKQNMGAAGKRREDELLKEIANLKSEITRQSGSIQDLKQQIGSLEDKVTEKDKIIIDL